MSWFYKLPSGVRAAIVAVPALLFVVVINVLLSNKEAPVSQPPAVEQPSPPPSPVSLADVEALFARIEKEYGYKPRLDTWGPGKGLFVPRKAWYAIKSAEQLMLIKYCRRMNARAIVVGEVKSKDVITLDDQVWSNTP